MKNNLDTPTSLQDIAEMAESDFVSAEFIGPALQEYVFGEGEFSYLDTPKNSRTMGIQELKPFAPFVGFSGSNIGEDHEDLALLEDDIREEILIEIEENMHLMRGFVKKEGAYTLQIVRCFNHDCWIYFRLFKNGEYLFSLANPDAKKDDWSLASFRG